MLPNLPEQHKKKEASFGIKLREFYKNTPDLTCAIETKQTNTDSFPFKDVDEEQLQYALAIRSDKGVLMRVHPFVKGMPDYIYMRNEPSWVVIYYAKRGFVFISPDRFILERDKSKRRSLLWSRAVVIATKVIPK